MSSSAGTRRSDRTPAIKKAELDAFLESLRKDASVSDAAKAAGISRRRVYELRKDDDDFRLAWDEAQEECIERVESKLYERASTGASDTAIIFFLKARRPHVFGDKLRHEEAEKIRKEAREEAIEEMQRQVAELTPAARKVLMAAIPRSEAV